jgi:nucleoside-diphosphate-sugar epimerase
MTCAGMRFSSVYQGYDGAKEHKGEYANVIAQFADDIANGESPKLYGDGTQTRTLHTLRISFDGLYWLLRRSSMACITLERGRAAISIPCIAIIWNSL